MKLVFLDSTESDLRWFKRYYTRAFPEGRTNANVQFIKTRRLLLENPYVGHPSDDLPGARELVLSRTPFCFVYRVRGELIEVLRVVDNRSDWRT